MEYIAFLIMKQKTKFKKFGNIGIGSWMADILALVLALENHIGWSLVLILLWDKWPKCLKKKNSVRCMMKNTCKKYSRFAWLW